MRCICPGYEEGLIEISSFFPEDLLPSPDQNHHREVHSARPRSLFNVLFDTTGVLHESKIPRLSLSTRQHRQSVHCSTQNRKALKDLDTSGDGVVSFDEFKAPPPRAEGEGEKKPRRPRQSVALFAGLVCFAWPVCTWNKTQLKETTSGTQRFVVGWLRPEEASSEENCTLEDAE